MVANLELMGREVRVADAKNKTLINLQGRVIDETKNTLSLETEGSIKKVLKEEVTLEVFTEKGRVLIKGEDLVGKPVDRIKSKRDKRRW